MEWDPAKYTEFADDRNRPFFDLTQRIRADRPRTVVDMGCGPGNLTAALAERWPSASVVGLGASPRMVGAARGAHRGANLAFRRLEATGWTPGSDVDLLVSNAMLQWVPDHMDVLAGWLDALERGAWFAAQVPGNFDAPSHRIMRDLAASPGWSGMLGGVLRGPDTVAEPSEYLRILLRNGFIADVWETTYQQVLPGQDPVLEWVRGTALRPVLAALDDDAASDFQCEYGRLVRAAYPAFPIRAAGP